MSNLAFLEQFDSQNITSDPAGRRGGFEEGFAAGVEAEKNRQGALHSDLIEKFVDISFGYAEAKRELLSALTPFIQTLSNQLLPALKDNLLQARIMETLEKAAREDLSEPIRIACAQSQVETLENVIPEQSANSFRISAEAGLSDTEILIGTAHTETALDVDSALKDIQSILSAFDVTEERKAIG